MSKLSFASLDDAAKKNRKRPLTTAHGGVKQIMFLGVFTHVSKDSWAHGAEIISTIERRRVWPPEEKLRIMSAPLEWGAVISAVADRNGVCRSQLYTWLRLAHTGRLAGIAVATKSPVAYLSGGDCPVARARSAAM